MEFVSRDSKDEACLFCRVRDQATDTDNLVLARSKHALLMLNAYPYTNGHLMAAPLRHTADFTTLTPEEMGDLMALVQRGITALQAVYHPDGFNVGANLGSAAGAGIADHLHMHVVPRWVGDTNFMAAVGDVRVLPDSLAETYRKVSSALSAILADAAGAEME
jgi:ATP adenylyltransferase